ncbi:MAG: hypothetical protein ACRDRA_05965 [Pseudonocardiaceae bacterium]
MADHDTHCGHFHRGQVSAACGIRFTPIRVRGGRISAATPSPGQLGTGPLVFKGDPPDPDQICPACKEGRAR